uniref:Gustatory receptor n=1 Tax=Anopheles dirus TaxID=7168 RepID=A0A182NN91_9DIPT
MEWARKWWTANATLVASALQVLFGMRPVTFVERVLSGPCGTVPDRLRMVDSATAKEGAGRGFFTMVVVLLVSCVAFSAFWHWCDEMALTQGVNVVSDAPIYAKSKRAFSIEVIVSSALPLLVAAGIYLYRWTNRAMIRAFNRNFRTLYRGHQPSRSSHRQHCAWERYGRLATKQAFEVMALGVLWLNLKPFSHSEHGRDAGDYHVGKLISSMGSMLPAVVCLLVSSEMGINFSFIALALTTLNWSLESFARRYSTGASAVKTNGHSINKGYGFRRIRSDEDLRKLIKQYDELGHFATDMMLFYSPIFLLIIGMHFVMFTLQVNVKLCSFFHNKTNVIKSYSTSLKFLLFARTDRRWKKKQLLVTLNYRPLCLQIDDSTVHILNSFTTAVPHEDSYDAPANAVTILSLIVNRVRDGTSIYGYFDLDRTLVMTIIASACSYLIVLIQVL